MLNGRFSGLGSDTETNFNLTYTNNGAQCVLQPFDDAATYGQSFKSKILVIEGIDLMSNANGHDTAGTILTGSYIDGSKPKNSSLDQYLAVERKLGAARASPASRVGVGDDSTQAGTTLSYGPGGAPLPKIIDPVQAFNTLFSGSSRPTIRRRRRRRCGARAKGRERDRLRARSDVSRLNARLAAAEQQKLQQHLDSIRDLEKQFDGRRRRDDGRRPARCRASPTRPTFPSLKRYNGGEPYFDAITNAFIDLLAQAFACDVTRFATLFMDDLSYAGNPLGLPRGQPRRRRAHLQRVAGRHPTATRARPATRRPGSPLAKFNRYSYGKVARFMQKLDGGRRRSTTCSSTPAATWATRRCTARATCRRCSRAARRNASSAWAAASRWRPTARPNLWCAPDRRRVQGEHEQPPAGLDRAGLRPHRRHAASARRAPRAGRPAR